MKRAGWCSVKVRSIIAAASQTPDQPVLRAVLLSLGICCMAFAQSSSGSLSGTVLDTSGAAIATAVVRAAQTNTNVRYETASNQEGRYWLPALLPGSYRIEVERAGFKTAVRPAVVVHVRDTLELDFELAVGDVTEIVTVKGTATTVNTRDATVTTVINRQFIENNPLNGRSLQSLLLLTPGVVPTKATFGEQGQFSINGQRANANYYTVDGVSANFGINAGGGAGQAGAGLLPALSATGGFNNLVSLDALQEFRIQTSMYAPEYGRTPGGQVSLLTRSGTNDIHGSASHYLRNDVLDANDWFENRLALPKAQSRQNAFGGVLGGPVRLNKERNRTFFFFSYEGLRLRQPLIAITSVPSATLRQTAPPGVQALLNAFPLPNGPDLGNGLAQSTARYSDPTSLDATSLRIDHGIARSVIAFARYNHSPSSTTQRNAGGQLSNPRSTRFQTRTLTAGVTASLTPRVNHEFRGNWSRQFGGTFWALDDFGGAAPITAAVLPSFATLANTLFSVSVISPALARYSLGRNGEGTQGQVNFVNNLSVIHANHEFRFGVDYRYLFPSSYARAYDLSYTFSSPADVRTGRSTVSTVGRRPQADYAYSNFSAYAQGAWRAARRLTISHGIRWDVNPAPHGRNGLVLYAAKQTDNMAAVSFAQPGTPLWRTTWGDIAPRVGAAYKVTETGSTVVRGGFGVFFDLPAGAISNAAMLSPNVKAGPAFATIYPADPSTIPIPLLNLTGPFANVMVTDPELTLPYVYHWSIAVEQALGGRGIATASYVGSAGRRLLRQDRVFNANPNFPLVQVNRNSATSDYNALQLQFRQPFAHGLQALVSYTWSHSLDNASNDSTALPTFSKINISAERGSSNFDVRHVFSAAMTKDVHVRPGPAALKAVLDQWSLDAIATVRSAAPVDVLVNRDLGFGTFGFRPDLVLGSPVYLKDANAAGGRCLNNEVPAGNSRQLGPFFVSPELRQGTLGRNVLRGFPAQQLDLAVRRRFDLSRGAHLQFRAEFFNLFNHPNFADPNGLLGAVTVSGVLVANSATFGQSLSMLNQSLGAGGQNGGFNPLYQTGGPRSVQLSLKLGF
ncbi:MAG: TonB-dependent receptor [Acidimicrobiia bacterium]|nr:TonB-dependent receptor [Acidimicrobiia bacterium]